MAAAEITGRRSRLSHLLCLSALVTVGCGSGSPARAADSGGADATHPSDATSPCDVAAEDATEDTGGPRDASRDTTVADGGVEGSADSGGDTGADGEPGDVGSADAGATSGTGGPPHAFVSDFNNGSDGDLTVFDTPLSATSTAILTLGASNGLSAPNAVRIDPGGTKLWVLDFGSASVLAFSLPLTTSSLPVTTLTVATIPLDAAFDASGNLWVGEFDGTIEEWAGPAPSGPSSRTLSTGSPGENVFSIAFDKAGALYAASSVSMAGQPALYVFDTPEAETAPDFSNAIFTVTPTGLIVVNDTLYVVSYRGGGLAYFPLPMTSTSSPTFVSTSGFGYTLSLSPAGQLVVPGITPDGMSIGFLAPKDFSTLVFSFVTGSNGPRGVAFGL